MFSEPNPELLHVAESDEFFPPISKWTTLGGLFLVGTVGAAITLAAFTKYNVTVKAPATVRPSGEIRVVQAATEGTVKTIAVKENQSINKGDVIAIIDSSQQQTKKSQLIGNIQQSQLQLVQLDAQIGAIDRQIAAEIDRSNRAVASAQADLNRQKTEYQERKLTANSELIEAETNIKIAQDGLHRVQAELKAAQANVKATEAALQAAESKRERYQTIAQSGSISKNQLEEVQLEVAQQQQALESQKATVESTEQIIKQQQGNVEAMLAKRQRALAVSNPSSAVVAIASEKIAHERATGEVSLARLKQEQNSLLQHKVEIQNQINNARKELQQLEIELQNTIVTSPESGTILKLELRNPGQVVRSGVYIAQVAPRNAPLLIKARVRAEDVSKVQVCATKKVTDCQKGKVLMRVSAYPYPDYGTLNGAVTSITADAITPQNSSDSSVTPYYEVTIEPERLHLEKGNQQYLIQPGMEVTADIIAKEETVLSFLLRKTRLLADL